MIWPQAGGPVQVSRGLRGVPRRCSGRSRHAAVRDAVTPDRDGVSGMGPSRAGEFLVPSRSPRHCEDWQVGGIRYGDPAPNEAAGIPINGEGGLVGRSVGAPARYSRGLSLDTALRPDRWSVPPSRRFLPGQHWVVDSWMRVTFTGWPSELESRVALGPGALRSREVVGAATNSPPIQSVGRCRLTIGLRPPQRGIRCERNVRVASARRVQLLHGEWPWPSCAAQIPAGRLRCRQRSGRQRSGRQRSGRQRSGDCASWWVPDRLLASSCGNLAFLCGSSPPHLADSTSGFLALRARGHWPFGEFHVKHVQPKV
jgi:hypothetical protein